MRKRTVKILKGIAIALVVLALIYFIAVGVSAAKLRGAYTALRADGRPMELYEIVPPEVPDTENAALLYESATLLLKALPMGTASLLGHLDELSDKLTDKTITPDELAELKELIDQDVVANALWSIEQGTQRRLCRFDLDYEAGPDILLLHLGELRQFARILGVKARIEAQAGRPNRAWDTVLVQLRLADAVRTEPVLISQLVRLAIARLSCGTIRELCEIGLPSGQQSTDIENSFKSFGDVGPLVLAVDGDRLLFGEWAFNLSRRELFKQGGFLSESSPDLRTVLGICFKPTFLAYHTSYLRIMHKAARRMEQCYSPETGALEEIDDREIRGLARELVPAMGRVKEVHAKMQADIRITRSGLALLRSKADGGKFPQTLAGFEPDDVRDPFSGEPLIYRSGAEGFVLYSVGPDGKDNGGRPKQDRQETDWDIVWQFPRPADAASPQPAAEAEEAPDYRDEAEIYGDE